MAFGILERRLIIKVFVKEYIKWPPTNPHPSHTQYLISMLLLLFMYSFLLVEMQKNFDNADLLWAGLNSLFNFASAAYKANAH
jgi:hypothetical protein